MISAAPPDLSALVSCGGLRSAHSNHSNHALASDSGLVHYIALSTELWFNVHDSKVNTQTQLDWLEADLKAATANRAKVPWVIAHGHRSMYCSNSDDGDCNIPNGTAGIVREDLEPLFYKYGVDLWINGHEHSCVNSCPMLQLLCGL